MNDALESYRRQIDEMDNQIITLLKSRLDVVQKVADFKREHAPNHCPIRAGREAKMLRRITETFKNTHFSSAAAAQIWRTIIGTSTALEATLVVSVFAPKAENDLYWLAREYFGPAASFVKQPHVKRVIGDVVDGKASVGIVPLLTADDSSYWWTNLLGNAPASPKIFAHLPFVTGDKQTPSALAFACLEPEDSGDDVSLYVLEMNHDVSQNRLQTLFTKEKLSVNWVSIATLSPDVRHHLIEIKGFITPQTKAFKKCIDELASNVRNVHFLGAYATPITLGNES